MEAFSSAPQGWMQLRNSFKAFIKIALFTPTAVFAPPAKVWN
jgi:hypothetical protein